VKTQHATIRFGKRHYFSALNPDQLLGEMQVMTGPRFWFFIPFSEPREYFGGEINDTGFRVAAYPRRRTYQPIPVVKGWVWSTPGGPTELVIKLARSRKTVFQILMTVVWATAFICLGLWHQQLVIGAFSLPFLLELWFQRLPHQSISFEILTVLEQRLRLASAIQAD
jgi:hypothetical protein